MLTGTAHCGGEDYIKQEVAKEISTWKVQPSRLLVAVLDEAQYVRHDEERGLLLVWSGAHSCSAYNQHGQEVTHWNMGDFAENSAGLEEVRESFEALIASGEYLEFYK